MPDLGLTHIAFSVRNLDASTGFYAKYARMRVVHERTDTDSGARVAWLCDGTRPFVIVLAERADHDDRPLGPFAHLGVACESREAVDALCDLAREEGCLTSGQQDFGPPVGYWAFLADPDGNTLEVSFGQEIDAATIGNDGT